MKIFISHAAEDTALAERLAEGLRETGLEPWLAEWEIMPGDNWAEKLGQGLSEADAMVVLLTPQSASSQHVRHEIMYALGEERFEGRLLPLVVGSTQELPADQFPWALRSKSIQWLSTTQGEEQEAAPRIAQAMGLAVA